MKSHMCSAVVLVLMACSFNKTRTPSGVRSSGNIFFVTWNNTDTVESFDRCRELIKPDHQNETAMIDRSVYDKCFADAMVGVDPNGQLPQPTPVDLNGDGRPDAVRYMNGLQVPYNLYVSYPGTYWPGVYQHYGYGSSAYPMSFASEYDGAFSSPLPTSTHSVAGDPEGVNAALELGGQNAKDIRELGGRVTELEQKK